MILNQGQGKKRRTQVRECQGTKTRWATLDWRGKTQYICKQTVFLKAKSDGRIPNVHTFKTNTSLWTKTNKELSDSDSPSDSKNVTTACVPPSLPPCHRLTPTSPLTAARVVYHFGDKSILRSHTKVSPTRSMSEVDMRAVFLFCLMHTTNKYCLRPFWLIARLLLTNSVTIVTCAILIHCTPSATATPVYSSTLFSPQLHHTPQCVHCVLNCF